MALAAIILITIKIAAAFEQIKRIFMELDLEKEDKNESSPGASDCPS
jgi:hypothetical protein